jgi:hypothetical protein
MRVKAKLSGERMIPLPDGGFWGIAFRRGEILDIPEQAYHPELFMPLQKPKVVETEKGK